MPADVDDTDALEKPLPQEESEAKRQRSGSTPPCAALSVLTRQHPMSLWHPCFCVFASAVCHKPGALWRVGGASATHSDLTDNYFHAEFSNSDVGCQIDDHHGDGSDRARIASPCDLEGLPFVEVNTALVAILNPIVILSVATARQKLIVGPKSPWAHSGICRCFFPEIQWYVT